MVAQAPSLCPVIPGLWRVLKVGRLLRRLAVREPEIDLLLYPLSPNGERIRVRGKLFPSPVKNLEFELLRRRISNGSFYL